jgi:predicted restriction endonuclease
VESVTNTKGKWVITINYEQDRNPHLNDDDTYWGTSIIYIKPGMTKGYATWQDASYNDNNGEREWYKLNEGLLKPREREGITRQKRNQAAFKAALLAIDPRCVLTAEDIPEALEAAHLIPSKKRGAEVIANGILLRADIHRLFDAGLIKIDDQGNVHLAERLPERYRSAVINTRLQPDTFDRVRLALKYLD